jgi:hypothetical protein
MKYSADSPELADFVDNLERINELAEQSAGFVWRLQTDEGDATEIDFFGANMLVNMSVWTDVGSLHKFVFRSAHTHIMARRKEWFNRLSETYSVLWWIPAGRVPDLEEARDRLECLQSNGPTPRAFTFKQTFDPPA